jgi:hypothetical protein
MAAVQSRQIVAVLLQEVVAGAGRCCQAHHSPQDPPHQSLGHSRTAEAAATAAVAVVSTLQSHTEYGTVWQRANLPTLVLMSHYQAPAGTLQSRGSPPKSVGSSPALSCASCASSPCFSKLPRSPCSRNLGPPRFASMLARRITVRCAC